MRLESTICRTIVRARPSGISFRLGDLDVERHMDGHHIADISKMAIEIVIAIGVR
jgi:hypothetical protein